MAKKDELTGDALTQEVVKYLHKGKNLKQVAELLGISVEEADGVWSAYVNDRKQMPFDQQFILHLERLENLLNIAHENLEGDFDSDDLEVTLKVLDRIEDLQATALSRKAAAEESLQVLADDGMLVRQRGRGTRVVGGKARVSTIPMPLKTPLGELVRSIVGLSQKV